MGGTNQNDLHKDFCVDHTLFSFKRKNPGKPYGSPLFPPERILEIFVVKSCFLTPVLSGSSFKGPQAQSAFRQSVCGLSICAPSVLFNYSKQ